MLTIPVEVLFLVSNLRTHQREGALQKRPRPLTFQPEFSLINIHPESF